jgi:hypothetical protein
MASSEARVLLRNMHLGLRPPRLRCQRTSPPRERQSAIADEAEFVACEQTIYERFRRWTDDGTWNRILCALLGEMQRRGKIDWSLWCVDGTSIRALKAAAGARGKNPAHARGGAPARALRPRLGAFPGWLGQ